MRLTIRVFCLAVLSSIAAMTFAPDAAAGEKRVRNYSSDSTALLDAINKDYGRPKVKPYSGYGTGPYGHRELNPYESGKWIRREHEMIDAINRDHPPVYPRNR